jgi:hypothetical protein
VKRSAFGHHFIRVVAGPDPIHPLRVKTQLTQKYARSLEANDNNVRNNKKLPLTFFFPRKMS